MFYIGKDERSPEYHGAIARGCGLFENANPYGKDDPRAKSWLYGFRDGRIENSKRPKDNKIY